MVYDRMIVCRGLLEFWPHQGRLPGSCELSEILIRSWSLVRHPVTARAKWKSFCAQQMWPRKTPVRMVVAAQRNGKNPRTGGKICGKTLPVSGNLWVSWKNCLGFHKFSQLLGPIEHGLAFDGTKM